MRKKSSKLVDFESPDEIDRTFTKKGPTAVPRKLETYDTPPRKTQKLDEVKIIELVKLYVLVTFLFRRCT